MSWSEKALGEGLTVKHGFAFKSEYFDDDPNYPVLVTPGNFEIGGGFKQSMLKTYSGEVRSEYVLSPGAAIVTMTDLSKTADSLGAAAMVPDDGRVYLHNQRIGLLQTCEPEMFDLRFIRYLTSTKEYRQHVIGTATGTTVRHTSPKRILEYSARIPGFHEQEAIAEVLGALDDKIAANETLASKLMEAGELEYVLGTERADSCRMSDALTPVLGGTPSRSDDGLWDGTIPWVSAKDISRAQAGFVIDTDEGISEAAAAPKRLRPLEPGSVVLTARGTVGAVARLSIAATINQSCYGFVPDAVPAGCLYFLVKKSVAQAKAMVHGSVFDTITKKTFDNVAVPDLTGEGWSALESRVGPMVAAGEAAVTESWKLARTRDELLPLLMSGKITVKDAEKVVSDAV